MESRVSHGGAASRCSGVKEYCFIAAPCEFINCEVNISIEGSYAGSVFSTYDLKLYTGHIIANSMNVKDNDNEIIPIRNLPFTPSHPCSINENSISPFFQKGLITITWGVTLLF